MRFARCWLPPVSAIFDLCDLLFELPYLDVLRLACGCRLLPRFGECYSAFGLVSLVGVSSYVASRLDVFRRLEFSCSELGLALLTLDECSWRVLASVSTLCEGAFLCFLCIQWFVSVLSVGDFLFAEFYF